MRGIETLIPGDLLAIYRTGEKGKVAEWSSVITSICTVVETKHIQEFTSFEAFKNYCKKGTVFSEYELEKFWAQKKYPHIIKMLYNIALPKRIVRHKLIDEGIISREQYAGFAQFTHEEFYKILEIGGANESFIIN